MPITSINIIGSGNVSWHFCGAWQSRGIKINSVYSKTKLHGEQFAKEFNILSADTINEISGDCDAIFIAVNDTEILKVLTKIPPAYKGIIFHCSGTIGMEIFKDSKFENTGCTWPIQSLTKGVLVDLSQTPVIINASNEYTLKSLEHLAGLISANGLYLDDVQKKQLHLAAVIANNFTNALWADSFSLLEKQNIDPLILLPILKESINKLNITHPLKAQTGPAVRNDNQIISRHLEMLKEDPGLQQLYQALSERIKTQHGKF
jgi:predicted short-subunit dehydrogenase-like oxidoreductase (DUF2520 family)